MAAKARSRTLSRLTFGGMVLAAGAIAWYSSGQHQAEPGNDAGPASTHAVTLAAPPPGGSGNTAADSVRATAGALPTRVVVPSAGIDAPIVEVGVVIEDGEPQWETAWRAAGHHLDSARPGQPGNLVLSGHVSVADRTNVAVFRTLNRVHEGDVVEVYAGGEVHRYRVDSVAEADPAQVSVLRADHRATLTLVTCTEDLKRRLVVRGTLI